MEISTLGFTKKSASTFFEVLERANITRLIDVRLHNASQLAGFTKRDDLKFFLDRIAHVDYVHEPQLAPEPDLLADYRQHRIPWSEYEEKFLDLLRQRRIEIELPTELFDGRPVLLCTEPTAEHCHRRLVAEYLRDKWGDIEITHL
jgi:uncharacterized protein (DUF488 family)